MSGTVNKAIIVGHLGGDPDVRRTQSGAPVASFSVATSETWRDKNSGERKEKTTWHRIVCFNEGLCKVAEQYLKKGMKVYVEGQNETRKWTDQGGVDRYVTEIVLKGFNSSLVMLERSSGGVPANDGDESSQRFGSSPSSQGDAAGGKRGDMDDEIPF